MTAMDHSADEMMTITASRLLSAGRPNGILYGPRSPKYQKDGSPAP